MLILCAIVITVSDVVARRLFDTGFIGLVDVTQLAVVGFAYLSMPLAFLTRSHVAVELFDHRLSSQGDAILSLVALILSISVLSILLYYGIIQAGKVIRYGDVSQNVEIPMIIFWIFLLSGAALSNVICLWQSGLAIQGIIKGRQA